MFQEITQSFQNVFRKITGGGRLTESNLNEAVREVRRTLLNSDVNAEIAKSFAERVKTESIGKKLIDQLKPEQQFIGIVFDELTKLMTPPEGIPELTFTSNRPTIIMLCGLNGAGKTTTAGKLALHIKKKFKKEPLLVAADLVRPAAVEQLQRVGQNLGIPVYAAPEFKTAKPVQVCKDGLDFARKNANDVVILDTAGRQQIDELLMKELEEVAKAMTPDHTFLVVDGMLGQMAADSAKVFNARINLSGVILTKMDGDAKGGAALSVVQTTQKPIRFLGIGEKSSDFQEFVPQSMAQRIIGHGDTLDLIKKVTENITREEAQNQFERMFLDEFNFEDFLNLMNMIGKMGPLKGLLSALPLQSMGVSQEMLDSLDEKEMVHMRAMVLSMTPKERANPALMDASRRRRVAAGSGTSVPKVNELLKQFDLMRQQMKAMKNSGLLGRMAAGKMRSMKEKQLKDDKKKKIKRW